ncbi:AbrB/MazE/SpoVT family DNA-binding domain-containing protein [Salinarimonas sp.]|uniref:antitoxin n=1 Tax=Salinarimonas sp. TaxID=2766526 RepID=UPI0032D9010A
MATAKVFKSDGGQTVQLPKEFAFESAEVQVFRRGDEVVLRELDRTRAALAAIDSMPEDMMRAIEDADDPLPQERDR